MTIGLVIRPKSQQMTVSCSYVQNVQNKFRGRGGQHAYNTIMLHTQPSIPSSLKFKWAAPEMVEGALYDDKGGACTPYRSLC